MSGNWRGSTRRARLPTDWDNRRAAVLNRDGHRCTWMHQGHRCAEQATDVDHIDRHGTDEPHNLCSLCGPHHRAKTSIEGNAAKPRRLRPKPKHPGMK